MIRVHERLKAEQLKARLILQVHDELIVECPEDETQRVKQLLEEEMEEAAQLRSPAGGGWRWTKLGGGEGVT